MLDLTQLIQQDSSFRQALTPSANGKKAAYERLEFLGDRVIGLCVADMLLAHHPEESEGMLAQRFVTLVRKETLAQIARRLNIPHLMKTKERELRENDSVLSDMCEAVFAAFYLKWGYAATFEEIKELWAPLIAEQKLEKDPKSELQEWALKNTKKLPFYRLISKTGPDHDPKITMEVEVNGKTAQATAHSKKAAEQEACRLLLKELI